MSYITFNPNQTVYVKGIGYGTLIHCGSLKTITQKVEVLPSKKESIYFDPDLFNSDQDSNKSKKSQTKSEEDKAEKKLVQVISETTFEDAPKKKQIQVIESKQVNIVQVKLQGCNSRVYTQDKNITKTIFIIVKPLLVTKRQQIIIEIEITKTIDTLRKLIFTQLGEQISNYYNIRLFGTSPVLTDFNQHSKTISQYAIKDAAKIVLTAQYSFGFIPLPAQIQSKYKILINGFTLSSSKIVEQAKKVEQKAVIALPLSENTTSQKKQQIKQQPPKQAPAVQEQSSASKQPVKEIKCLQNQQQKVVNTLGPYIAKCQVEFNSGKRYWQLKLEKIPTEEEDLVIGVNASIKQGEQIIENSWEYHVVSGKKVFIQNDQQIENQSYGYIGKINDSIGVLLTFKGKKCEIVFYKSSISCGLAFQVNTEHLINGLTPFVAIGGDAQVTLDSKAQAPLDSFRSR